jgi:hypothetical protein
MKTRPHTQRDPKGDFGKKTYRGPGTSHLPDFVLRDLFHFSL